MNRVMPILTAVLAAILIWFAAAMRSLLQLLMLCVEGGMRGIWMHKLGALIAVFTVGFFVSVAIAEEWPEIDQAAIEGFSAIALITTNLDFMKDWETPRENPPQIATDNKLVPGEKALLRVLFARISRPGEVVSLDCGVTVSLDGKQLQKMEPTPCVKLVMPENITDVYLTGLEIKITADSEDIGKWHVFDIAVTDRATGKTVRPKVGYLTVSTESGS